MRALVTGGAGFIGSHIVDDLQTRGYDVAVLDDLSTGRSENVPKGVPLFETDIRDATAVDEVFAAITPQLVSHHAAQTSVSVSVRAPADDAAVNILGTINVLDAARRHGTRRVIFASTGGAIYGEVEAPRLANQAGPLRPQSGYACAKLSAENYLRLYGRDRDLATVVMRYANVYGPRQVPHAEAGVVAIFADRLRRGQPLQINAMHGEGDDGCIRDYVFVRDVVAAHATALTGAHDGEIFDVGSGIGTTTRALAHALADALGVTPSFLDAPPRAGDVGRSVLDPTMLTKALGELTPLSQGLAATLGAD